MAKPINIDSRRFEASVASAAITIASWVYPVPTRYDCVLTSSIDWFEIERLWDCAVWLRRLKHQCKYKTEPIRDGV